MKKKDIRFIIIFLAILIFAGIYLFQTSYAKYRRQIKTDFSATIASWNIKVNNEMINNKTELTNTITPVINNSTYVKEGTIAPGTTGYFDLTIDATLVDVDFTYTIDVEPDTDTPLLDFIITSYTIGSTTVTLQPGDSIIEDLVKNTGTTSLRINFAWDDSATNQMDNEADTEYAIDTNHTNTDVTVSINFIQKR